MPLDVTDSARMSKDSSYIALLTIDAENMARRRTTE